MGWTEHRLDYEVDNAGLYVEERIDPLEMYWDRTSKRKNLVDARLPLADAMGMFPGKSRSQLDAVWAIGTEIDHTSKTIEKRKREENTRPTPTTTSQRGPGLALARHLNAPGPPLCGWRDGSNWRAPNELRRP